MAQQVFEQDPFTQHLANGVTTVFAYEFMLLESADLVVYVDGSVASESDYMIAGLGTSSGGTVTFGIAPANGLVVLLSREMTLERLTEYQTLGDFRAVDVNPDFNRIWMALQGQLAILRGALRLPYPEQSNELPAASARANCLLGFDGDGQPLVVVPVSGDAADLAIYLASIADSTKGAGQVGYGPLNYEALTVGGRLMDIGASPRTFGAAGDGVTDDASAISACFLRSRTLDLRNRAWKIGTTIDLPAGCVVDMRGATIHADTGSNPLFKFDGAKEQVAFLGGGGMVDGVASAFLLAQGSTNAPTDAGQYARQIRLEGVHVTSPSIGKFLDLQDAVRQVFVDKCMAYTASGIDANGKCVEVMVHKTILYSSTSAAGTYGLRLRSPGGTTYYNEGFHLADCTIDAFEKAFDVTDIFVLTASGGYAGCAAGGYVADFGQPVSNLCSDIKFNGMPLAGRVRFAPTGGRDYDATFTGCTSLLCTGTCIQFANNASSIAVRSHKFRNSTTGVAIEGVDNNHHIVIDGIDCDTTFVSGVQLKGANGAGCVLANMTYAGSGDPFYLERPVRLANVPISTAAIAAVVQSFNASDLAGTYAVGVAISTKAVSFAEGERGCIVVQLPCSGMDAGTQRFDLAVPSGMVVPGGSGWSAGFIHPSTASGLVSARIPYYCTADGAGDISITNAVGNTVTLNSHGYFGLERAW